jgi:outer membrane immunogenic protein
MRVLGLRSVNQNRAALASFAVALAMAAPTVIGSAHADDASYIPLSMTPAPPTRLSKTQPEGDSLDAVFNGLVGSKRNRSLSLDPSIKPGPIPTSTQDYIPNLVGASVSTDADGRMVTPAQTRIAGAGDVSPNFKAKTPVVNRSPLASLLGGSVTPESPVDWSGVYAGMTLGGAAGRPKMATNTAQKDPTYGYTVNTLHSDTAFSTAGVVGGAFIGANVALESYVVGVEAGIVGVSVSDKVALDRYTQREVKLDSLATVRGRIGVPYGQALVYVTGGGVMGVPRFTEFSQVPDTPASTETKGRRYGWLVGGGVDYAFDDHWIARAEYTYVEFAKKSFSVTGFDGQYNTAAKTTRQFNLHNFSVGLAYKY